MKTEVVAKLLGITLIALSVLIAVYVILVSSANMPFLDQFWFVAPTAIAFSDGQFSLDALVTWGNEHRLVFTMLTNIVSILLAGWNTNFEVWVNLLLGAATFIMLTALVVRYRYARSGLWLSVPIAFLIFAARQGDNWMRGYSHYFYGALLMLWALWFLLGMDVRWRGWWATMLCVFAASWSFAGGLTLWVAMLPALWLRGYCKWRYYIAWLLAAIICVALYFVGYQPTGLEQRTFTETLVFDLLVNVVRSLGGPLVPFSAMYADLAFIVGSVGILLVGWHLLYLWNRVEKRLLAVPIVLVLYSIGNGVLTVYGRSFFLELDPSYILWPRYVTQANFLWIALLLLGGLSFQHLPKTQLHFISSAALLLAIPLYMIANYQSIVWASQWSFKPSRACFLNYLEKLDEPCFARIIDGRKYLDTIVKLAERRLSAFNDWYVDFPPASQPRLAHVQPILGTPDRDFLPHWITLPSEEVALFQHPPSTVEQHLQLPDAPQVFFEAEIYVDLRHIREHPEVPQTGADFRLGIREGRHVRTLYEGSFDVNVETAPIPIRVDLSTWRGRAVVLVYETLVREGNPSYAHAMWRNPRLTTQ